MFRFVIPAVVSAVALAPSVNASSVSPIKSHTAITVKSSENMACVYTPTENTNANRLEFKRITRATIGYPTHYISQNTKSGRTFISPIAHNVERNEIVTMLCRYAPGSIYIKFQATKRTDIPSYGLDVSLISRYKCGQNIARPDFYSVSATDVDTYVYPTKSRAISEARAIGGRVLACRFVS